MHKSLSYLVRPGIVLAAGLGLALTLACGGGSVNTQNPDDTHGWTGPVCLESNLMFESRYPSVAMDATGNGLVMWQLDRGGVNEVWGRPMSSSGAWAGEGSVSSLSGSQQDVRTAVGGDGTFMFTWDLNQGSTISQVYVNRWDPVHGLSTPLNLNTGFGYYPAIAMNGVGDACVVWMELGTTYHSVLASRFNHLTGMWTAPEAVSTTTTAHAAWPTVGMDNSGNVAVLWAESTDLTNGPFSLEMAVYRAGHGWTATFGIQAGAGHADTYYSLAMTAAGAQVAWSESTDGGSTYQVYSRRYTASDNTLSAYTRISPTGVNAFEPTVALDTQGNAILAWSQGATSQTAATYLYASSYTNFGGWQATPGLAVQATGGLGAPKVAMNASGTAFLVWLHFDGSFYRVAGTRYLPGSGWGDVGFIQTATSNSAYSPDVAVGANGQALASWYQKDAAGLRHIYANRYR